MLITKLQIIPSLVIRIYIEADIYFIYELIGE